MKKLMLQLDDLAVESFDTSAPETHKGTVVGEECSCGGTCFENTCPETCAFTCDDHSCAASCDGTCGGASCFTRCIDTCLCP